MQNDSMVFLDYASTTPVDPRVVDAMLPYFDQEFGNPSSIHKYGQRAEAALEDSRQKTAQILNTSPGEVIFTSCGSESDNLALRGVAIAERQNRSANHILVSSVEHHAVLHTAYQLRDLYGFEVELIPVDEYGRVDVHELEALIRSDTAIVSVIYGNNEVGTLNRIADIGAACKERGVPFHTDAVQAAAYLPIDVHALNVDLLSLGAHKFYGPKGVGALYVRNGTPIIPMLTGGSQENNLRAGTYNIPYIVGFAEAFSLVQESLQAHVEKYNPMRQLLISSVLETIPHAKLTGHPVERLPNHASFVFEGVDGNTLLMLLDSAGFACSSGSACKTGDPEPSDVLISMGVPPTWALGSLRVTLGQHNSIDEINDYLKVLPDAVQRVRDLQSAETVTRLE